MTVLHEGDEHTVNNGSYEFPLRGRNIFLAMGFRMSTREAEHANFLSFISLPAYSEVSEM